MYFYEPEYFTKMNKLENKCLFITGVHVILPSVYYLINKNNIKYSHPVLRYYEYGVKTWSCLIFTNVLSSYIGENINIDEYILYNEIIKQIIFLFLFDLWFYCVHYSFHKYKFLYKKFHYVHHIAVEASPLDGIVSDPIEGFMSFNLPGVILSNMLNIHVVTQYLIIFIAHLSIFVNHSFLDKRHLNHHKKIKYNFSSTIIPDLLFGTEFRD